MKNQFFSILIFAGLTILFEVPSSHAGDFNAPILDTVNPDDPSSYIYGFHESFTPGMIGWDFQLNSPITITQVGWYDYGHDGLMQSYQVGLWENPNAQLATGNFSPDSAELLGGGSGITISGGTSSPLEGAYRVVNLDSPITLQPGEYQLGGLETQNSQNADPVQYILLPPGPLGYTPADNAAITIGEPFAAYGQPNSDVFGPTSGGILVYGVELGPMLFQAVPEPSNIGFGLGAAAFWVCQLVTSRKRLA